MKLVDVYNEYLKYVDIKLKPQSIRSIKSRFNNYIIPYFKNKNYKDITAYEYLEWQKSIDKKDFSYAYKKSLHYAMVELYSFLDLFHGYNNNIPKKVGNFFDNSIPKDITYWTMNEYEKFSNVIPKNDFVYKIFFDFLYFTGCRLGEANALTFGDVNEDVVFINKTISKEKINGKRAITMPKTKKAIRKIRIDNYLTKEIERLKEYYKAKSDSFNDNFFVFGGIKPLSPSVISRRKNDYCVKAKIKTIRIHDFRHSHATLLLDKGIPLHEISNRLGHESINTTLNTYTHLMPKYEKRVVDTLNSLRKY